MKLLKYCVNQKMNANSVKSVFQGPVKGLKRSATVMQDALAVKNASMDFAGQHLERVKRVALACATKRVLKTNLKMLEIL